SCIMPERKPGGILPRSSKKGRPPCWRPPWDVRLSCRSGSGTSGGEDCGEGLSGRSAILADGRKIWAVRHGARRMVAGCLREPHPIVGERLEEGDEVRLVGRAEPQVLDAGIQVVDVRLV